MAYCPNQKYIFLKYVYTLGIYNATIDAFSKEKKPQQTNEQKKQPKNPNPKKLQVGFFKIVTDFYYALNFTYIF